MVVQVLAEAAAQLLAAHPVKVDVVVVAVIAEARVLRDAIMVVQLVVDMHVKQTVKDIVKDHAEHQPVQGNAWDVVENVNQRVRVLAQALVLVNVMANAAGVAEVVALQLVELPAKTDVPETVLLNAELVMVIVIQLVQILVKAHARDVMAVLKLVQIVVALLAAEAAKMPVRDAEINAQVAITLVKIVVKELV